MCTGQFLILENEGLDREGVLARDGAGDPNSNTPGPGRADGKWLSGDTPPARTETIRQQLSVQTEAAQLTCEPIRPSNQDSFAGTHVDQNTSQRITTDGMCRRKRQMQCP